MIDINLSDHDKKVLRHIGSGPYGKELAKLLQKIRDRVCSLDGIDREREVAPQVEGRLLFKDFADELVTRLTQDRRQHRPVDIDEME